MRSTAVLLVEDDFVIGEGLKIGLTSRGFTINWERTAGGASRIIKQMPLDVIVLDLGLPDTDGMIVLERLRNSGNDTPIVILTARDAVNSRIKGLDLGADDYIVKPVTTDELAARIRAAARRNAGRASEIIKHGKLSLDTLGHQVYYDALEIKLTPNEFSVLHKLATNVGRIVPIESLIADLELASPDISSESLRVHIHSLRKKIDTKFIETIRGVGYIIKSS
jgi:two-component system response regulator QseB